MPNILRVRNLAQKVLWDSELSGQISDGQWENSSPGGHWKPWCDATVVIDPSHPGKNFWAQRSSYNFSAKDLLDVVGERMVEAVRVATGDASYDMTALRKDLNDLKKIIKENVGDSIPLPAQPRAYSAKLMLDGYAQVVTTFVPLADDPRAVAALAKREEDLRAYRVKQLEDKRAKLLAQVAETDAALAAL